MKREYIVIGILILIIFLILGIAGNYYLKVKEQNGIIQLKDRSIESYRSDLGQTITKVQVTLLELNALKEVNTKQDSTLARMKALYEEEQSLNKKLNSMIAFNNRIIAKYSDSLNNVITSYDSTVNNGVIYYYPTYTRDLDMFDNWITGKLSIGKNIFDIDLSVNSKYDIYTYRERDNIFSKYKLYTNVKLHNPYETTDDLIVINEDNSRSRFNVSVFSGVVFTNKVQFGIGIGIGYTLFTF